MQGPKRHQNFDPLAMDVKKASKFSSAMRERQAFISQYRQETLANIGQLQSPHVAFHSVSIVSMSHSHALPAANFLKNEMMFEKNNFYILTI